MQLGRDSLLQLNPYPPDIDGGEQTDAPGCGDIGDKDPYLRVVLVDDLRRLGAVLTNGGRKAFYDWREVLVSRPVPIGGYRGIRATRGPTTQARRTGRAST